MEEEISEKLNEQVDLVSQIYEAIVDYLVGYSFQIVAAVLIIIAGIIVARWVSRLTLRVMEKRDVDTTLRQFIASAVRIVVIVMFAIMALQQAGISITPLLAAMGGLAVGLSLAIQGPVSNYGAGLIVILTRMYKVGDTITTQGCTGLVEEITLAATQLRAEDGELIVIPNKHIVGEIHTNSQANRIVEGQIGIAYSEAPERAIEVIETVLAGYPDVASELKPEVGISGFGDSSIDIAYRFWAGTGTYYRTVHAVNLAIFNAFREQGIVIPFPQREVRMLNQA